jgi:caffeoyl-CoA O-methyltransferase
MHEIFGREDTMLATLAAEARAHGLPDIAINADVGRLLMILTSMTRGKLAIEVGTLGGYSAIWIARGLAKDGRLITIEAEPKHADFAAAHFKRAGLADQIQLRRGYALDILPQLTKELEPGSVDVVFLDAEKTEYPSYWNCVRPLIALGGLIIADNVLGSNSWWIDEVGHPMRDAADQFNRAIAGDESFEAVAIRMRQGVLIGRRMR